MTQLDIGVIVGCTEKTLRHYYRDELAEGLEQATAVIVEALHREARKGNVTAMIFYEKCKGGKRETVKEEIVKPKNPFSPTLITPRCELSVCDSVFDYELPFEFKHPDTKQEIRLAIFKIKAAIAKEKARAQNKICARTG